MATPPASSGIEITARFFPLAFLLLLFPPTFVIDGQAMPGKWREGVTIPVSPGSHHVKVFFRYLWIMDAGNAEAQVDVTDGSVRRVSYKAPWLVFLAGKITVA
jgi:hypothetical protein